jgi:hypothetical protein
MQAMNAVTVDSNQNSDGRINGKLAVVSVLILIVAARFSPIPPSSELGYWIGVVGAVLMLSLLLYPLRKRVPWLNTVGSMPVWFAVHMACGVIGPVLILWHCRMRLGSLNAAVAFWCMVVVATSGLAGRYLYARLHAGLYGRERSLNELKSETQALSGALSTTLRDIPAVQSVLNDFSQRARNVATAGIKNPIALLSLGWFARRARAHAMSAANGLSSERKNDVMTLVGRFTNSAQSTAQYRAFERLFSLWHVAHIPLVFVLAISAIAHVIAVHLY